MTLLLAAARVARAFLLSAHVLSTYPTVSTDKVVAASVQALNAETSAIPAELLIAIAEHESDLNPNAASWRAHGRTVSILWDGSDGTRIPARVTCGYLQAMASREDCRAMIVQDGGMHAGVAELGSWLELCRRAGRPGLRCALRGHAGGTRCAFAPRAYAACSGAVWFSDAMLRRARFLGAAEAATRR